MLENREYIVEYFEKHKEIAEKLNREQNQKISEIIQLLFEVWKNRGQVLIVGNGGSASTATHFAADLSKTTINSPQEFGVRALALVDNIPLVSAATNDWGWDKVYDGSLSTYAQPGDVFIALSVHGGSGKDKAGAWSQNLLRAMQMAKDKGLKTVGFAGFDGGAMKDLADVCVVVPADSTPHVESFHVVLHHLITFRLKELITLHKKEGGV